jgi:hypothetical protein
MGHQRERVPFCLILKLKKGQERREGTGFNLARIGQRVKLLNDDDSRPDD